MAEVKIKWNPNWRRELEEMVTPALREMAAKRTGQYGELVSRHQGGDADVVKTELVALYKEDGGEITDPELTQHADAIVAGRRLVFEA